jgi:SAM-dependent methyltransferase
MIKALKSFANRLSIVTAAYEAYQSHRRTRMSTQEIFTEIFHKNAWKGVESASGPGSDPDQTERIIMELAPLLNDLEVETMLDIPCGDFNWMKMLNLNGITYIGMDIVEELIRSNKKYEADNITFAHADLLTDQLPKVDLILCRDCLVHFSFADIERSLRNVCHSKSKYFLTTTHPDASQNVDITTGAWRPLNLQIEPFNFPVPLRLVVEGCTEQDRLFKNKSLALWRIDDIRQGLTELLSDEFTDYHAGSSKS